MSHMNMEIVRLFMMFILIFEFEGKDIPIGEVFLER